MPTSGIYRICCLVDGKVYVGSSVDMEGRWKHHYKALQRNKHHSRKLQRAWNKHGAENFEFWELDFCDVGALLAQEQHWIDELDSVGCGYNCSPTAGSNRGYRFTEEQRKRLSAAHMGQKIGPERLRKLNEAARLAFTGRSLPEETKQKISASLKGRPISRERAEKLHAARREAAARGRDA